MKRLAPVLIVVVLFIGILVWYFWPEEPGAGSNTPTTATVARTASAVKTTMAQPTGPMAPVEPPARSGQRVVLPTAPPVPAAPTKSTDEQKPPPVPLTDADVRAVRNNLRQFSSAAQQYMLDKGVTRASYYDFVGTGTDDYLRPLTPVAGESYDDLIMTQTQSEISVTAPDGTAVTFSQ